MDDSDVPGAGLEPLGAFLKAQDDAVLVNGDVPNAERQELACPHSAIVEGRQERAVLRVGHRADESGQLVPSEDLFKNPVLILLLDRFEPCDLRRVIVLLAAAPDPPLE